MGGGDLDVVGLGVLGVGGLVGVVFGFERVVDFLFYLGSCGVGVFTLDGAVGGVLLGGVGGVRGRFGCGDEDGEEGVETVGVGEAVGVGVGFGFGGFAVGGAGQGEDAGGDEDEEGEEWTFVAFHVVAVGGEVGDDADEGEKDDGYELHITTILTIVDFFCFWVILLIRTRLVFLGGIVEEDVGEGNFEVAFGFADHDALECLGEGCIVFGGPVFEA